MPRHAWSLADELSTLTHAVSAARRLADTAMLPDDLPPADRATTVASIAGVLAIVECRLNDLGRVVRGEVDPARLRASHNAVNPDAVDDPGDVFFRAWGPKRRATEAQRQLALIERYGR